MSSLIDTNSLDQVLKNARKNDGFLTMFDDVSIIAKEDRLRQILVRCNNCRFLAAAQDVKHLCDIIDASNQDWVRDVSLPTTDPIYNKQNKLF